MSGPSKTFRLDPRLAADTVYVARGDICQHRLMNDARWPWLILIPEIPGAIELHDLMDDERDAIVQEAAIAGAALKKLTGCEKINTGALGNIVRQLHIHVVARSEGDPNWPGPVWGFGKRVPYASARSDALIKALKKELHGKLL